MDVKSSYSIGKCGNTLSNDNPSIPLTHARVNSAPELTTSLSAHTVDLHFAAQAALELHSFSKSCPTLNVQAAREAHRKVYLMSSCRICCTEALRSSKCACATVVAKCVDAQEKHVAEKEAEIMIFLSTPENQHRNIVHAFHYSAFDQGSVLLMEMCSGMDLCALIDSSAEYVENGLPEQMCWSIIGQLLDGVKHLHKLRVAHRDLKPDNMMWDVQERCLRIIDLGLSQIVPVPKDAKPTLVATFPGTYAYAPPEVVLGIAHDPFSHDIWSIGCSFYVMMCRKFPFGRSAIPRAELVHNISVTEPTYFETMSSKAIEFIRGCLRKPPCHRSTLQTLEGVVMDAKSIFPESHLLACY